MSSILVFFKSGTSSCFSFVSLCVQDGQLTIKLSPSHSEGLSFPLSDIQGFSVSDSF